VTHDRSYTTHEQYIFQVCDVESWRELWERAPKIELIQALMAEGLIGEVDLRRRMVHECVCGAENKSAEIKRLAEEMGMAESNVRRDAYAMAGDT